jgi:nucleotide-binding universal stress UspA family protein
MGVLLANTHETAGASQAGVKLEPAPVKPTSKPEDLRAEVHGTLTVPPSAIANLAGDFLAAHGAPHRLYPIATERVLLEEMRRRAPRLLVMGAHGQHHSMRELFATSVTRAVLTDCSTPVFLGD